VNTEITDFEINRRSELFEEFLSVIKKVAFFLSGTSLRGGYLHLETIILINKAEDGNALYAKDDPIDKLIREIKSLEKRGQVGCAACAISKTIEAAVKAKGKP